MLMLGWTTVATPDDAARLARGAVQLGLAACVQTDAAVESIYVWQGKVETAREVRLLFKFLPERGDELKRWLLENHPYETPEWLVVRAEQVSEKYLSWARANSTSAPF